MSLINRLEGIFTEWRECFTKQQAWKRCVHHVLAIVTFFSGRATVSNHTIFMGRDQGDHTADYALYSRRKWCLKALFRPILSRCIETHPGDYFCVAVDASQYKKTGKQIPGTTWMKDPLGPKFQVNLLWGKRFLQFSALLPLHTTSGRPCRAVPVDYVDAPPVIKPNKKASQEEWAAYKEAVKQQNLSTLFVERARQLRDEMDQLGHENKRLLIVADGSFSNKTCMNMDVERTHLLARVRKDTKLCFRSEEEGGRRVYQEKKFTPKEVLADKDIPWKSERLFYGGAWREMRFKEVTGVLWQSVTKTRPLRLIVLAPVPYVKGGRRGYRDPAFLITTDLEADVLLLIQAYCDRWQIEVNFREEKSIFGVGQSQVWNEESVSKRPGLQVVAYAALLIAGVQEYGDAVPMEALPEPLWRPRPERLTCRRLRGMLRKELAESPHEMIQMNFSKEMIISILSKAA